MQNLYHQLIGKERRKGQLLIITSRPIKFTAINGIRGVCEESVKGELIELVQQLKIKEFSSQYDLPSSTVKRLRKGLGITKLQAADKEPVQQFNFIKIES